jgi:uncharacterized membrane protein YfcA
LSRFVPPAEIALFVMIGFLAGTSNALVGGGTLFTFPVLLANGISPIIANTTCTIALWPGTVTSASAYRRELRKSARLGPRVAIAIAGGLIGARLLLLGGNDVFFKLVPWLLAMATVLFTFGRAIMARVMQFSHHAHNERRLLAMEFASAIYGGYFGAGIGIFLLASMALAGEQDVQLANAQRNFLVVFINGIAAVLFIARGVVDWPVAVVVMAGAIAGGYFGARVARRIPNRWLRLLISAAGAFFSVYYFFRAYG